jgi:hypothetical protein|tara:strand:- start:471 stop:734 length:264 start_codon:yes stop_codon:yes gene_type:complete
LNAPRISKTSTDTSLSIAPRQSESWGSNATALGTGIITLALLNAFSLSTPLVSGVYLISVFWHVLQAAILLIMLIWIPSSRIEKYMS